MAMSRREKERGSHHGKVAGEEELHCGDIMKVEVTEFMVTFNMN